MWFDVLYKITKASLWWLRRLGYQVGSQHSRSCRGFRVDNSDGKHCNNAHNKKDTERRSAASIINANQLLIEVWFQNRLLSYFGGVVFGAGGERDFIAFREVAGECLTALFAHKLLGGDQLIINFSLTFELLNVATVSFSWLLSCHSVSDALLAARLAFTDGLCLFVIFSFHEMKPVVVVALSILTAPFLFAHLSHSAIKRFLLLAFTSLQKKLH
jgi:hypothetical protein